MPTMIAGRPRPSFSALRRLDTAGWTAVLSGDSAEAARWLEGAAHYGMVEAQTAFAQILLDGQGVPRDSQAAFAWFTSAAHAGHPAAMNMLGRCLERGWGVAVDYSLEAAHLVVAVRHKWSEGWTGPSTIWPICCCVAEVLRWIAHRPGTGFCAQRSKATPNP